MRLQNPFAAINTTGIDSQVLVVLARADDFFTVNQIHTLIPENGSVMGIRSALTRLVIQGTVIERQTGRSVSFALNRSHLLAEYIRGIATVKSTFIEMLRNEISQWNVQPIVAQLFGSAARGDMSDSSDIDLLFIMPSDSDFDSTNEILGLLASKAQEWTGNDVRPLLYNEDEISPAPIFDSIIKEGINLAGDPAWLRRKLHSKKNARK